MAARPSIVPLVLLLAGCGTVQVRTWTEVEEPPPETSRRVGVVPVLAGAEFQATEHRIEFELEGIYETEGVRRLVERETVREHDPWVEAGEMAVGVLLAPAVVASAPFYYGIVGPLQGFDHRTYDIVDYLAFIPEAALDPTENDLFGSEETRVVATREERYSGRHSALLQGEEAAGAQLSVLRVQAAGDEGSPIDLRPETYRLERWTLVLPEPLAGVASYSVDLALEGWTHTIRVPAE